MKKMEQTAHPSGQRFSDRVRSRYAGFTRSEMILLANDRRLTVRGCGKIISFAPDCIRVAMRRRDLLIRGAELCCTSFSGGCITVEGRIQALSFCPGGEKNP